MTNLQLQKLKMYLKLQVLFDSNPSLLSKMPNAREYLDALNAVIETIKTYKTQQGESGSQNSEQKKLLKAKLIANLIEIERRIQAFANYKKDTQLLNSTKLAESELKRMDELALAEYAKSIYSKGNEFLAELERYGLTSDILNTLRQDIGQYEILSPQLSKEKLDKKNITTYLGDAFKDADELVNSLDMEVEIIHSSEPKFYADYKALSKVDRPTDVMQLIGKVTDAVTGAPVPNATVTLALNDSQKDAIVKQTAEKGGFQLKSITNGIYTVTVVKLGYLTQSVSITITGDEPYSLDVKMVKA